MVSRTLRRVAEGDKWFTKFRTWLNKFFDELFAKLKGRHVANESLYKVFGQVYGEIDESQIPQFSMVNCLADNNLDAVGDMKTLANKVKNLNLDQTSVDAVENTLIDSNILNISVKGFNKSLSNKVKQYYVVGTASFSPTIINPQTVKSNMKGMLAFCDNTPKATSAEQNAAEAIQQAAKDLASRNNVVVESVIDELVDEYLTEASAWKHVQEDGSENPSTTVDIAEEPKQAQQQEKEAEKKQDEKNNTPPEERTPVTTADKKKVMKKVMSCTSEFISGVESARQFKFEVYTTIMQKILQKASTDIKMFPEDDPSRKSLTEFLNDNPNFSIFSILSKTTDSMTTATVILYNKRIKEWVIYNNKTNPPAENTTPEESAPAETPSETPAV